MPCIIQVWFAKFDVCFPPGCLYLGPDHFTKYPLPVRRLPGTLFKHSTGFKINEIKE